MKLRMNNRHKDFYTYMGPIFGSRDVEAETNDRFYDDDNKEWILNISHGCVDVAISINDEGVIRNVYITNANAGYEILFELFSDAAVSVVPRKYVDIYEKCGYKVRDRSVNFVKIYGGAAYEGKSERSA